MNKTFLRLLLICSLGLPALAAFAQSDASFSVSRAALSAEFAAPAKQHGGVALKDSLAQELAVAVHESVVSTSSTKSPSTANVRRPLAHKRHPAAAHRRSIKRSASTGAFANKVSVPKAANRTSANRQAHSPGPARPPGGAVRRRATQAHPRATISRYKAPQTRHWTVPIPLKIARRAEVSVAQVVRPQRVRPPAHAPDEPRKNILYAVEPIKLVRPDGVPWPTKKGPVAEPFDPEARVTTNVEPPPPPPLWLRLSTRVVGDSVSASAIERRPRLALSYALGSSGDERSSRVVFEVGRTARGDQGLQLKLELHL